MYKLPYFLLALVGISAALTPGHGTIIKHEGKPVGHEVVHKNSKIFLTAGRRQFFIEEEIKVACKLTIWPSCSHLLPLGKEVQDSCAILD